MPPRIIVTSSAKARKPSKGFEGINGVIVVLPVNPRVATGIRQTLWLYYHHPESWERDDERMMMMCCPPLQLTMMLDWTGAATYDSVTRSKDTNAEAV